MAMETQNSKTCDNKSSIWEKRLGEKNSKL